MNQKLTDQKFWNKYWQSKNSVKVVSGNIPFHQIFTQELSGKDYHTMIEIGGFPGHYAIYFRKYHHLATSLLDYISNNRLFTLLLKTNKLKEGDITLIKEDFFKYKSQRKYDVVFSLGFIEHFDNTLDVIQRHWKLVNSGGKLIIGIPNFLGINGRYQQLFDPANLKIHNLDSMDYDRLASIAKILKPENYHIDYVSGKLVWLENLHQRPYLLQILTYLLNLTGAILTLIGINSRLTATHIFLIMEKK